MPIIGRGVEPNAFNLTPSPSPSEGEGGISLTASLTSSGLMAEILNGDFAISNNTNLDYVKIDNQSVTAPLALNDLISIAQCRLQPIEQGENIAIDVLANDSDREQRRLQPIVMVH